MSLDVLENHELDHHAMVEAKIVRMANQIATYFQSRPDTERAFGIAAHINDYWEPRMRVQLFDIADKDPAKFNDLVQQALMFVKKPQR